MIKIAANINGAATTLTVVVVDESGDPAVNANVSISPSDSSQMTNEQGEVKFMLGDAKKYDVTASYGNSTVTVPYYVTSDGATRLVVNPVHVAEVEKNLARAEFWSNGMVTKVGIGIGVLLILIVLYKMATGRR